MTDRPILFSAPMVRALLDGRKTQTRRPFKPHGFEFYAHPISGDRYNQYQPYRDGTWDESRIVGSGPMSAFGWGDGLYSYLPYHPGDRLWVKETWRAGASWDDKKPTLIQPRVPVDYVATPREGGPAGKTRVSIFMPRWASRLTLLVTDVRVERLQDCSETDALAEGIVQHDVARFGHPAIFGLRDDRAILRPTAADAYSALWDSINGAGNWASNPWIVAVSFTLEQRNIDA